MVHEREQVLQRLAREGGGRREGFLRLLRDLSAVDGAVAQLLVSVPDEHWKLAVEQLGELPECEQVLVTGSEWPFSVRAVPQATRS